MDIIYVLVPLSILLIGIAVVIFFWAVKSGQFDDMESPAHKILFDDDDAETIKKFSSSVRTTSNESPATVTKADHATHND